MKQAKASDQEVEDLIRWLQKQDEEKFLHPELRPPAYARVVYGYQVLKDNCTDPAKDYLDWKPGYSPTEVDALRAENADLRRDRERMDWLEKKDPQPYYSDGKWRIPYLVSNDGGFGGGVGEATGDSLRAAIDAAIAARGGKED